MDGERGDGGYPQKKRRGGGGGGNEIRRVDQSGGDEEGGSEDRGRTKISDIQRAPWRLLACLQQLRAGRINTLSGLMQHNMTVGVTVT